MADLTAMAQSGSTEPDAADADESIAAEVAEHEVGRQVPVEQGLPAATACRGGWMMPDVSIGGWPSTSSERPNDGPGK